MSDKFLDTVILFSVIGILVIGIYKNFIAKKSAVSTKQIIQNQQLLSPTPKQRAQITCNHPYFNFQPGTTWEYTVTDDSQSESATNATPSANILLTVVKNEVSSVTLLATDSSGMKKNSTITCTDEGLTGLPLEPVSNAPVIGSLLFSDYLFLPQNVKKGVQWSNSIFDLKLLSTITDLKTRYVKGDLRNTFSISSHLETPPSLNSKVPINAVIDYDVLEDVGITEMNFNISLGQMMSIKKSYTLIMFKPGNPI